MLSNNIEAQDFIAADLLQDDGEYSPQFDSQFDTHLGTTIIVDPSLDDNEWYWDFSQFHG